MPRIDLPAKLSGAAFVHDVLPKDVLHARTLRQPSWTKARVSVCTTLWSAWQGASEASAAFLYGQVVLRRWKPSSLPSTT